MAVEISKIFSSGQADKGAQPAAKEKPKALGDGDIFAAMGTVIKRSKV